MKGMKQGESVYPMIIPKGKFCGHNCADGCIYWKLRARDVCRLKGNSS